MNAKELNAVCEPVAKALFTEHWSHQDQLLIQGHGFTVDESYRDRPVIVVSLRVGTPGNERFAQRWDNTILNGVRIRVEIRPIARM